MRRALREFLYSIELEKAIVEDVLLAAGEASANAIEHAYRDGSGEFRLRAFATKTHIVVEVSDRGSWRMEGETNRGRGLGIMHALADRVAIETTRQGTTVRLELAL
jgi:anti-sigma regulatory factor (Ser/Thr protein kinase)